MKRFVFVVAVALVATLLPARALPALGANEFCDSVTGSPGNGECIVNTAHALGTGAQAFSVDRTLRITTGGALTVTPPSTLTLNIAGGALGGLIIENGGRIAGNTANGTIAAATININVAEGDIVLADTGAFITADNSAGGCGAGIGGTINIVASGEGAHISTFEGSVISASGLATCSGGTINISAPNKGQIDIDGAVLSNSNRTGVGNSQNTAKGGGPISIEAACDLTVSDTGLIRSFGRDPGADLVHLLGGCDVLISGKVFSETIGGHGLPVTNFVHSNKCGGGLGQRPEKEFEAVHPNSTAHRGNTACVEIWAGKSLEIRGPSGGEVRAGEPQAPNRSWIDLFSGGPVLITGTTPAGDFAVRANGAGTTNTQGGTVTVKSRDATITMSDKAIQATGSSAGGNGGTIIVQSHLDIDLDTAHLDAHGDFVPTVGIGGTINVQSLAGNLSWTGGIGDVRDNATGTITLTACGTVTTSPPPTNFNGEAPLVTESVCPAPPGDKPAFQAYVSLPLCTCDVQNGDICEKGAVKGVLHSVTGRFPGNLGPDDVVRLDLGETVQGAVTGATDLNGDGFIIIVVVKDGTGALGGQTFENVVIDEAYEDRFALIGCSVTIRAADPGLPAGHIATTASSPPGSAENIFVMDLHGADSDAYGWLVEGDGRYLRNVANRDNGTGVAFFGDGNVMHNGNALDSTGIGLLIEGNGNFATDTDLFGNGGWGAQVTGNGNVLSKLDVGDRGKGNGAGAAVTGDANQVLELDVFSNDGDGIVVTGNWNTLKKNDVGERSKGNAGDGIGVSGWGNQVLENNARANTGDGFDVNGGTAAAPNVLKKNKAGDRDQGNGANGYRLRSGDAGNGAGNPIELEENSALSNVLNGFLLEGPGHQLKKNVSGNSGSGYTNGDCEYLVVAGNFNATGNKSNGTTIAGANGSAFPTACIGTP